MTDRPQRLLESGGQGLESLRSTLTALRHVLALAALLGGAGAAIGAAKGGRDSIAVFRDWGAFREADAAGTPTRCFAIAEPPQGTRAAGTGAYAAVSSWPARRIRAQVSIHLSKAHRPGAPVTLTVGDSTFLLTVDNRDAWPQDRLEDARVVAAMRTGSSMSISTVTPDGNPFADSYRLRGAASAIDAALFACPMAK